MRRKTLFLVPPEPRASSSACPGKRHRLRHSTGPATGPSRVSATRHYAPWRTVSARPPAARSKAPPTTLGAERHRPKKTDFCR